MKRRATPDRRAPRWFGIGTAALALSLIGGVARGQGFEHSRAGVDPRVSQETITAESFRVEPRAEKHRSPVFVTLASALVPGTGQIMLGQRRGAAYLVLEAIGIGIFASQTADGRSRRREYREISREVARAAFSPDGPGGDWDYYERMQKFVASGALDAVAGGDMDPEPDVETYNGAVWLLARQTYWRDAEVSPLPGSPEYASALRFYLDRAVGDDMRWSWLGEPEAYRKFRAAIDGSNSAFRSAGQTASVLLANHFLSAVDAYVAVRLRARQDAEGRVSVAGRIPFR